MSAKEYTITAQQLQQLDALYADDGEAPVHGPRNRNWGLLVEALRAIRRQVEAGVVVKLEGTPTVLTTWQAFYAWAHGRYHLLEEGADHWIGDDQS